VRHWQPYLWGHPFIKTDHYSLKFLLDQKLATVPQHQWVSKLFDFDFSVEYRPGTANVVTEALSRRDMESTMPLMALSATSFRLFNDLRQEFDASQELRTVWEVVANEDYGNQWRVVDGLVTICGRVYIPLSLPLTQEAIADAHGTSHEGVQKTLHRLRTDSFVRAASAAVQDFMRASTSANATRQSSFNWPGSYSRWTCPTQCGLTCPWTLSKGYRGSMANR
jgi:hypothetical protein